MTSNKTGIILGIFLLVVSIESGAARKHFEHVEEAGNTNLQALEKLAAQNSNDVINRWMLMKRDLLNITIDTDKIDETPLTAEDLLLRVKLMAYVQKLVDKEEKKKAKEAKKAAKANAKAELLGLPAGIWGQPPSVTVSPPLPVPTSVNLSGSEPLPPTGFWLYKKAEFLTKLFSALAEAAATLPGVTTEAPAEDASEEANDNAESDSETDDDAYSSIVNVNDKRSVDESDEYENEYEERVYVEAPATKMLKSSKRKPYQNKHTGSKKFHGHKSSHKFHGHEQ